jgi:hypothetical protein
MNTYFSKMTRCVKLMNDKECNLKIDKDKKEIQWNIFGKVFKIILLNQFWMTRNDMRYFQ